MGGPAGPGRNAARSPGPRSVPSGSREKIEWMGGLTDDSICPTLLSKALPET
jgi:hypothetical protein